MKARPTLPRHFYGGGRLQAQCNELSQIVSQKVSINLFPSPLIRKLLYATSGSTPSDNKIDENSDFILRRERGFWKNKENILQALDQAEKDLGILQVFFLCTHRITLTSTLSQRIGIPSSLRICRKLDFRP